ncbi:excalibur calcium-binding domain-containing protein [Micromonospora pisi]|uniref:Excalibur calcium-binding domain-containing protein n=1 Tax=Micromonospora pisi TaxID=589240 RepID=A0A495JTH9_9ACTN|nr:excalibur calcium-binding domain-containing protein [Micromonospora pisi]RKR92310.1 excalibur calcium-binding domain-containing protein [Micromonospora pisi]
MSQPPPLDNQRQVPRAVAYRRGNQAAARYRSPVPRPPEPSPHEVPARPGSPNRRRFWLFALALLVTLGISAATLGAVFAGQSPTTTALAPDGASPAPVRVAPPPAPPTPRPPTGTTPPARQDRPVVQTNPGPRTTTTPPRTAPTGQPAVSPTTAQPTQSLVVYKNCGQARKAGVTPLRVGDPGYSTKLDKDGDGVACEKDKD